MKPFRFREFDLYQQNSLLKVGTDSMLLGAFTNAPAHTCHVLDIGTGTGVLALICAQKYAGAEVTAIEPDGGSCTDARHNFSKAPWSERLILHQTDLQGFETRKKYDLVIANPPYYENGLFNATDLRSAAKHETYLPLDYLVERACGLLAAEGRFELILPAENADHHVAFARTKGLHLQEAVTLRSKPGMAPVRRILHFGFEAKISVQHELVIRNSDNSYTDAYLLRTAHLHRFTKAF